MSEMVVFRQFIENEVRYAEDVMANYPIGSRERRKWEVARAGRLGELIARQLATWDRSKT
jgi:hypothetical protein